jgi:hypothetical protein
MKQPDALVHIRRDPRTETRRAFHRLIEPIPGLADLSKRRRRSTRFFVFGGCLFWLVFGLFYLMAWMLILTALVAYIAAVVVARLLVALGWLTWWGLNSGTGAIGRLRA